MSTDQLTQGDPAPGAETLSTSDPSQEPKQGDEGQQGAPEEGDEDGEKKQGPTELDKVKHAMQKRLDKVYSVGKDWERRAQAAEERLAKLEKTESGLVPPKEEDFDDAIEYGKALGKYESQKEALEKKQEEAKKEAETADSKRSQAIEKDFKDREQKFAAQHADYGLVIEETKALIAMADKRNPAVQIIANAMLEDEHGPAIAYHFGKNPDAFDELLEKSPYAVIRALAKIEGPQGQAPGSGAPAKPNIPAPPNPIGGKSTVVKQPSTMNPDDLMKWVNS